MKDNGCSPGTHTSTFVMKYRDLMVNERNKCYFLKLELNKNAKCATNEATGDHSFSFILFPLIHILYIVIHSNILLCHHIRYTYKQQGHVVKYILVETVP